MKLRESMQRMVRHLRQRFDCAYGFDQLGVLLILLSFVSAGASWRWGAVWGWVSAILLCFEFWRMLSTNLVARRRENDAVMGVLMRPVHGIRRLRNKWKNRKAKAYVKCPTCHKEFALPKGKGKLRATCPHCGEKSIHTV